MANITIKVNDYLTCNKGITPDEGEAIFKELIIAFGKGQKVVLDFADVEMMTIAFLNVSIGKLYETNTCEELKDKLSFYHISDATALKIKKVTDNAKSFYSNKNRSDHTVYQVQSKPGKAAE